MLLYACHKYGTTLFRHVAPTEEPKALQSSARLCVSQFCLNNHFNSRSIDDWMIDSMLLIIELRRKVIKAQLAHANGGSVRWIYNQAQRNDAVVGGLDRR